MKTEAGVDALSGAQSRGRSEAPVDGKRVLDHVWDLGPGQVTPSPAPGARQAGYNVAAMLAEAVRDELALSDEPLRGLVIGCGEGWIAHRLLDWGLAFVLGIDEREEAIGAALNLRDRFALAPDELALRRVGSLAGLGAAGLGRFDLAFVAGRIAERAAAFELARASGVRLCAIESGDRLADRAMAREVGFGTVSLAEPAADSERRIVLLERALLLARPRRGAAR